MKIIVRLILFAAFSLALWGQITTDTVRDGDNWTVVIKNSSSRLYEAMVVSADVSYRSAQGRISVPAGEVLELAVIRQEEGTLSEDPVYLRFISDHPDNPGILVLGEREPLLSDRSEDRRGPALRYFFTPDCSRCREFLNKEIPRMEEELGIEINLERYDVTTSEGLKEFNRSLAALSIRENRLPLIIGGDMVLAGDGEIEKGLRELVIQLDQRGSGRTDPEDNRDRGSLVRPGILPVILAGLLDGINPCAFSTLIFLISWLGLAGRQRREILITGILFTASVFITYYAVGLGAFAAVRSGSSITWLSLTVKYLMAAVLAVLAVIHILDYRKVRQGRYTEMTLQLSRKRKRKIHSLIRENMRKAGLFSGSALLGVAVTIYELGCTGQIYLPTLMYMARSEKEISAFFLLGLYNLSFVVPLIAVFTAAWKGTGSEKLARWFTANLGKVKLLSAAFFLMMALLLLFI